MKESDGNRKYMAKETKIICDKWQSHFMGWIKRMRRLTFESVRNVSDEGVKHVSCVQQQVIVSSF